jgi:hypothetical protein
LEEQRSAQTAELTQMLDVELTQMLDVELTQMLDVEQKPLVYEGSLGMLFCAGPDQ